MSYDTWKLTDPNDTIENARYADLCADYYNNDKRVDEVIKAGNKMDQLCMAFDNYFVDDTIWTWLVKGYEEKYTELIKELDACWPADKECEAEAYLELKESYPW